MTMKKEAGVLFRRRSGCLIHVISMTEIAHVTLNLPHGINENARLSERLAVQQWFLLRGPRSEMARSEAVHFLG
jgi:hypothetical protein